MNPWWMKLATHFYGGPKIARAMSEAPSADRVYIVLLDLNTTHSCDGRIPADLTTDPGLAARLPRVVSQGEIQDCLRALELSGLISREADRTIVIRGWDDNWRPPVSAAERARNYRERKKS